MKTRKNKGITLIALVITIIVLLILAGVSIAMLTGENGILNQATEAKEKTETAAENEKNDLAKTESQINQYTGNNIVDGVKIPEGFYYVGGSRENGLVISDVQGDDLDNTKQGNQFVWVPVENFNDFTRRAGYYKGSVDPTPFTTTELKTKTYYEPKGDGIASTTEVEKMYRSVKINRGFYIGRYESGKDANGKVICQKGATVYNNIKWGNSMSDETGGMVELARDFATEKGYTSVTSTLCYGVQWDAALKFIDPAWDDYTKDSTGRGNYSGSIMKTGSNEAYKMKNIYDMAGNVHDVTMESYDTIYKVPRGGYFNDSGFNYPASVHSNSLPDEIRDYLGFRVTLFL